MRSVPEWRGKTDDDAIPPRVRLRIFERCGGICHVSGRTIRSGQQWDVEHIVALCNGGKHSEYNMAPVLRELHREKTRKDVEIKSMNYRKRTYHLGIKRKTSKPIMGSKRSGWKRRLDGTVVKR